MPGSGRVVIVTGASSGLGAATARAFAREGASVVIAARRADRSRAVVDEVKALGGDGIYVPTDVTVPGDIARLVEVTLRTFGRLDCAVNNAGTTGPVMVPLADVDEAAWDAVMNVNAKAAWLCMKHEIPAMLAQGGGAIVNVASIYGLKPSDVGHAAYCASKHAVIGLSRTAAIDYGRQGIRVNAVAPGLTRSEMVDPYVDAAPELVRALLNRHSAMDRLGEADETAATIAWLCSDAARFVNGAVLSVDGGPAARLY
jgi:NAD(P)-dependent dehydrogenase (short-subunit alcohol dehydrogenase family)